MKPQIQRLATELTDDQKAQACADAFRPMTQEHSPLPWRAGRSPNDSSWRILTVPEANCVNEGFLQADADFIVRAVNNYEPMLDALKLIADQPRRPANVRMSIGEIVILAINTISQTEKGN